jgi:hypothetical protein
MRNNFSWLLLSLLLLPAGLPAASYTANSFHTWPPSGGWSTNTSAGLASWLQGTQYRRVCWAPLQADPDSGARGTVKYAEFNCDLAGDSSGTLTSPAVALPNPANDCSLGVYLYNHSPASIYSNNDTMWVEITTNGGSSWSVITTVQGSIDSWTYYAWPLGAYSGQTLQARFRVKRKSSMTNFCVDEVWAGRKPNHDAGVTAIKSPAPSQPGTAAPVVTVRNAGGNPETFPVTCRISLDGNQVYNNTVTVNSMVAGTQQDVAFPAFTAGAGDKYDVTAFTALTGDSGAYNDTLRSTVKSYNASRSVFIYEFTATWCTFCPYTQNSLQTLKEQAKDSVNYIGVHFSSSDSFKTQHGIDIYNTFGPMSSIPRMLFDGFGPWVLGAPSQSDANAKARQGFDLQKKIKSPFGVTLTGTRMPDGSSGNIRATINYPGTVPVNAYITMAILEESKYNVWPYIGANPIADSLRDFIRDMFPSTTGDAITIPAGKGTVIKDIPFTNAAGWNKPRLEYVVWVYDLATKEIYNSAGIGYAALAPNGVELSEFTASAGNGEIILSWRTASETDNYQWLLERSTKPDNGFSTIAVIEASNNPNGQTYSFSDNTAAPLTDYYYRLGDKDVSGNITWNGPVLVTSKGEMITSVSLAPSCPNPSRGQATIRYTLPRPAQMSLRLYDITGRLIRTLASGYQAGGSYAAPWDGKDESGREVSSGIYLYQLRTGSTVLNGRLTMIR